MSNVVGFKKPTSIQPTGATLHEAIASVAALPAGISEIRNAQAQLKEDVRITILMLDLAVAHGRLLANAADDPRAKHDLEAKLASIQNLLEIARQRASEL
jgi:signal transduction histidine kinase